MLAIRPDTDAIAITRAFDGIEEAAHRVISQIGRRRQEPVPLNGTGLRNG